MPKSVPDNGQAAATGARVLLESEGFVVVKAKSYRAAQERQRIAEALREAAEDRVRDVDRWAQSLCETERGLRDRLTFVYGVAKAHGASDDELAADAYTQLRELLRWSADGIPDNEVNRSVKANVRERAAATLAAVSPSPQPSERAACDSTSMGYRCSREAGHGGWHEQPVGGNGFEAWTDSDADPQPSPLPEPEGRAATCGSCGHPLPHNERWGCMTELGDGGSGSVADAVFCKCTGPALPEGPEDRQAGQ